MITEKTENALFAIQAIIIVARNMTYEEISYKKIANLLDMLEELPRMIAAKEDMTEIFRKSLENIIKKFPECAFALERFDDIIPPHGY